MNMAVGLGNAKFLLPFLFVCLYQWSFHLRRVFTEDTVAKMLNIGFLLLLMSSPTSKQPCSVVKRA